MRCCLDDFGVYISLIKTTLISGRERLDAYLTYVVLYPTKWFMFLFVFSLLETQRGVPLCYSLLSGVFLFIYFSQSWLRSYFPTFAGKSLSTDQMKAHFLNHFTNVHKIDPAKLQTIDWDLWVPFSLCYYCIIVIIC